MRISIPINAHFWNIHLTNIGKLCACVLILKRTAVDGVMSYEIFIVDKTSQMLNLKL